MKCRFYDKSFGEILDCSEYCLKVGHCDVLTNSEIEDMQKEADRIDGYYDKASYAERKKTDGIHSTIDMAELCRSRLSLEYMMKKENFTKKEAVELISEQNNIKTLEAKVFGEF